METEQGDKPQIFRTNQKQDENNSNPRMGLSNTHTMQNHNRRTWRATSGDHPVWEPEQPTRNNTKNKIRHEHRRSTSKHSGPNKRKRRRTNRGWVHEPTPQRTTRDRGGGTRTSNQRTKQTPRTKRTRARTSRPNRQHEHKNRRRENSTNRIHSERHHEKTRIIHQTHTSHDSARRSGFFKKRKKAYNHDSTHNRDRTTYRGDTGDNTETKNTKKHQKKEPHKTKEKPSPKPANPSKAKPNQQ